MELGNRKFLCFPCGFVVEREECAEDNGVSADAVIDPLRTASLARGLPLFVDASNISITRQNRRGYNATCSHHGEMHLNSPSSAS